MIQDQNLNETFNTSLDIEQFLETYFKPLKVTKNEILVSKDKVCNSLFYILKGSIKAYFIDQNGQESIRYVAFDHQFISSIYSFMRRTPSNEYICAIEPCDLLTISYTDFKLGLKKNPIFKEFYIKMLEGTYLNNHWRIETLLRLDAKQRYDYILKHQPQLVLRLSNKNLASFLGITQESLSRIKAKK